MSIPSKGSEPAFPQPMGLVHIGSPAQGMTQRDLMATIIMSGLLHPPIKLDPALKEDYAKHAYAFADAMLKQRDANA